MNAHPHFNLRFTGRRTGAAALQAAAGREHHRMEFRYECGSDGAFHARPTCKELLSGLHSTQSCIL